MLLCTTLSTHALLADSIGFPIPDGSVKKWPGETTTNYLLSFDFRSRGKDGVAKMNHGGKALFTHTATGTWQSAKIAVNTESGIHSVWLDGKPLAKDQ
jgi:hypothetical protein